uniref:Uncharacterized protein n=1 Tax=Parascaris equorum TaxID=6256 RepID=A0A914R8C0_PAREQ
MLSDKRCVMFDCNVEGVTYADVQVFDDIHEMEGVFQVRFIRSYASDEDEDRANLYWYFMDRNWDRKFFPMNIAYVRARNAYYTMMSKFLQRMGMSFDYQIFTYEQFLRNIDRGEIEEKELRIFFGSTLTKAFREESIPGIADFMVGATFFFSDYILGNVDLFIYLFLHLFICSLPGLFITTFRGGKT